MGLHFGIWTAFTADAYMNMLGIDGAIAIAIAIAMATSSGSSGSTNMEGGG